MKVEEFSVGPYRVGYIVRGRPLLWNSNKLPPLEDSIHGDCILPEGHIAGFQYQDQSFSEAKSSNQKHLIRLKGNITLGEEVLLHYRNMEYAQKLRVHSTFLLFSVELHQAIRFTNFWKNLKRKTPYYNICFSNCATLCYEAFIEAGILRHTLIRQLANSIMEPSKLYQLLLEKHPQAVTGTGFLGVAPDTKNDNKIILTKSYF